MNKHLQHILEILQQENLTADQKNAALKSLKDADKELEITAFKLDKTEKVKHTTAVLLEETIAELEQKRKAVEVQNRELEIEAALERVRARTMAMRNSKELNEVIEIFYLELKKLESELDRCFIMTFDAATQDSIWWMASGEGLTYQSGLKVQYHVQAPYLAFVKGWQDQIAKWRFTLEGKEKKEWDSFIFSKTELSQLPEVVKRNMMDAPRAYWSCSFQPFGSVSTGSHQPLSEDAFNLLIRFSKVFDLTYTRFLDLQKAEAQARESQIQLALERVRARTMAMQRSDELAETASLLFKQVLDLGVNAFASAFQIWQADGISTICWASGGASGIQPPIRVPHTEEPFHHQIYDAWQRGDDFFVMETIGPELESAYRFLLRQIGGKEVLYNIEDSGFPIPKNQVTHCAFFSQGYIMFNTYERVLEAHTIFNRFAKVFEQTYTRFLDLQKAEAQAREARIEAALERVRAQAMAMHKADELLNVCEVMYKELKALGFDEIRNAMIHTFNKQSDFFLDYDFSGSVGGKISQIPTKGFPIVEKYLKEIKKSKDTFLEIVFTGEELDLWRNTRKETDQLEDSRIESLEALYYYYYSIGSGDIGISTFSPISKEKMQVLERFRNVFQLSYQRYRDIEKAEAQAREAKIEAALERVRSRSMAMHKSEELKEVIQVVFEQLLHLNFKIDSASLALDINETDDFHIWTATAQQAYPILIRIPYFIHPLFDRTKKAIENKVDFVVDSLSFEEKNAFWHHFFNYFSVPKERQEYLLNSAGYSRSTSFLNSVALSIINYNGISFSDEENAILTRFGKVFEQAYTRFLDLQKAEAQAREARIETALEKVRSRTMAMQHSSELAETSALLDKQVRALGIQTVGCAFNIYDEDQPSSTEWFSNLNGNIGSYKTPREGIFLRYYEKWQQGETLHVEEFKGDACVAHYEYLSALPGIGDVLNKLKESGIPFPISQIDHVAYFKYGYLLFITFEPAPEAYDIFIRFAKVFEQTYTRFLDLQKAEAQARESQIQLALERVRAKTMAMQSSNDLLGVANVLREQMGNLGQPELESSIVHLYNDNSPMLEAWYAFRPPNLSSGEIITGVGIVPKECSAWSREVMAKYNSPETEYTIVASGDKLMEWYKILEQYASPTIEYDEHGQLVVPEVLQYHFSKFSGGALLMISNQQPSAEARELQRRAAVVFDLAYTRFLDLKKAEAQAREAKIEAALEKVRSRSLAMHNSSELSELVATLFDELIKLDLVLARCIIWILNEDNSAQLWMANSENKQATSYHINGIDHSYYNAILKGWRERSEHWVYELKDKEKASIDQILLFETELSQLPEEVKHGILSTTQTYVAGAFNKFGLIEASGPVQHTGEQLQILHRFNKVFEQSYTRFLDLQKAEEQAREATIEAALEKVRGKAIAMHNSNDLLATASSMFTEVKKLGIKPIRCGVGLLTKDSKLATIYRSTSLEEGDDLVLAGTVTLDGHPVITEIYNSTITGEACFPVLKGELLKTYYEKVIPNLKLPDLPPDYTEYGYFLSFKEGFFYGWSARPIVETDIKILNRFKLIIDLTFRRYIELQNAEAQAREAKIEAALERVRGKAMAMHSSEDLTATISAFYHELELFSITPRRCGVGLLDKETHMAELSTMNTTELGESIEVIGRLKMTGHPVLEGVFDNWLIQKEYHPVLRGNEIKEYYQLIRQNVAFPEYPNDAVQYGYFFFFTEGGVYAWTEKELIEDELKIYRRFTSVLSLTYKRYKDLRDAEARTQLAIRESSLDRVRAGIASMRTAEDLQRITPLVWHELITLGVPFLRCGVFIINEEEKKIHTYLTNPQGKSLAALHLGFESSETNRKAVEHWRIQKVYTDHWDKVQFTAFAKSLLEQGQIEATNTYQGGEEPPESLTLQFIPFAQGMLYVGSGEPLSASQIELVQALAEAFSVAYARYEDFTKLELAKAQIEKTLTDLKQTQTQLVQSEKMASLGELTAGIAHEIQNPLNFVNNFSEVSTELVDEMNEELQKGNTEDAKLIALDLKQNLEKINHHGKRAGDIVKGMLQHSRSSTGVKEPTDINALADEYLRLAYHGLRAKDKSFNAKFEMHADPDLPKLSVLPQDMGRVILNLINNAFYAVSEKRKLNLPDYEPTVLVSTQKLADRIEIKIKDNGTGIPARVKEKIFQPFFTTKPTGQGTGLGLSLSYDIISKGHSGEIKLETKEGEGTEFIIQLPIV